MNVWKATTIRFVSLAGGTECFGFSRIYLLFLPGNVLWVVKIIFPICLDKLAQRKGSSLAARCTAAPASVCADHQVDVLLHAEESDKPQMHCSVVYRICVTPLLGAKSLWVYIILYYRSHILCFFFLKYLCLIFYIVSISLALQTLKIITSATRIWHWSDDRY